LRASVAIAGTVLLVFAAEGIAVALKDLRDAGDATSIGALEERLDAAVPAGSRTLGDNRLWPALRDQEHRSLLLLFYLTNPRISRERTTDIAGAFEQIDADYLLLSPLSREILSRLTPGDAAAFERYVQERGELVGRIDDRAYGPIEVYRLR
jgi:hypothetical protein